MQQKIQIKILILFLLIKNSIYSMENNSIQNSPRGYLDLLHIDFQDCSLEEKKTFYKSNTSFILYDTKITNYIATEIKIKLDNNKKIKKIFNLLDINTIDSFINRFVFLNLIKKIDLPSLKMYKLYQLSSHIHVKMHKSLIQININDMPIFIDVLYEFNQITNKIDQYMNIGNIFKKNNEISIQYNYSLYPTLFCNLNIDNDLIDILLKNIDLPQYLPSSFLLCSLGNLIIYKICIHVNSFDISNDYEEIYEIIKEDKINESKNNNRKISFLMKEINNQNINHTIQEQNDITLTNEQKLNSLNIFNEYFKNKENQERYSLDNFINEFYRIFLINKKD